MLSRSLPGWTQWHQTASGLAALSLKKSFWNWEFHIYTCHTCVFDTCHNRLYFLGASGALHCTSLISKRKETKWISLVQVVVIIIGFSRALVDCSPDAWQGNILISVFPEDCPSRLVTYSTLYSSGVVYCLLPDQSKHGYNHMYIYFIFIHLRNFVPFCTRCFTSHVVNKFAVSVHCHRATLPWLSVLRIWYVAGSAPSLFERAMLYEILSNVPEENVAHGLMVSSKAKLPKRTFLLDSVSKTSQTSKASNTSKHFGSSMEVAYYSSSWQTEQGIQGQSFPFTVLMHVATSWYRATVLRNIPFSARTGHVIERHTHSHAKKTTYKYTL